MKQEHKTYEEALHELEAIVDKMENNQLGLDELTSQLKHAQQLIKLCKGRLTKTDTEIRRILEKGDKTETEISPSNKGRRSEQEEE